MLLFFLNNIKQLASDTCSREAQRGPARRRKHWNLRTYTELERKGLEQAEESAGPGKLHRNCNN